ncbi:hypothetical protein MBM09_04330 [Flaviramulus sp. BrNp1-15]|uniref:hypothetical protein n=1 Tax=Flaviramulus sp. BrNp1-15 TaxID=2916754 RepID=UPI001EE80E26|nr:hypothetical protein [Flaviramulus sp. BrNp1-15]ULC60219.1 hypothetical protein MBM09_04330 [Flaviramulus sp. BrNp1-15]
MKTKFFSILITCFVVSSVFSQSSLNNYKYIIVPNKFDFLKEKDQYQLNSLTQFLFNKYGFEAVMEGSNYPEDLSRNRCLALESDVLKDSGMFKTKLKVELKDCNGKLVFTSDVGESRDKEFKTAYNLALRDAFKSFEVVNYKYEPNEKITALAFPETEAKKEVTQEIKQLKQEIEQLKKDKETKVVAVEKTAVKTPVVKPEQIAFKQEKPKKETVIEGFSNVLYAQEIQNGFQLVDSSPKVVYRIKNTNLKDVFLVENESAIIYQKDNNWVIEYYIGSVLKQEELNIKF